MKAYKETKRAMRNALEMADIARELGLEPKYRQEFSKLAREYVQAYETIARRF